MIYMNIKYISKNDKGFRIHHNVCIISAHDNNLTDTNDANLSKKFETYFFQDEVYLFMYPKSILIT